MTRIEFFPTSMYDSIISTTSFQYDEEDVVFILQEKVVFGAVHHGSLGKFTIKPCPKGNEECHLLIHKLP